MTSEQKRKILESISKITEEISNLRFQISVIPWTEDASARQMSIEDLFVHVPTCRLKTQVLNVLKCPRAYRSHAQLFPEIKTVEELLRHRTQELLRLDNFGKKSLAMVISSLERHGLELSR